ncbi:restriction endonuclease subunit S [uncultured Dialister sp.]|uniref:restriction endonuclease subunit S n=1 Tax=uncultured Dialister sp. TaxID=278064 RepID=UPI00265A838C|nr:restriction endonuclease subunit S [uncultured Dialister sp.]
MESILLKDIIQKPISGEWGLEDLYGTGIPVLRTANFTNEGIINFENVVTRNISPSKLKGKLLQKGDILLEKSGGSDRQPVGRVVYFDGQADKYGFNNFTSALRISDLTMWNPKYIFYALYANYHHGGTRKYENKTTGLHNLKVDLFIRSFSVPYATLIKQNEIVKKLDLLNHLENVCEVQLQKLDELIKSRFIEMFGDLINEPKYPGIKLGSLGVMITGGTPSRKHDEYYGGNIPFISTPCLESNFISEKNVQNYLTEAGVKNSATHKIPPYSLMVGNRVGVGRSSINTCEMCTNQDILSFVDIDTSRFDLLFLKKVIDQYSPYFDEHKRGATIQGVPSKVIKDSMVPDVPLEIQKRYTALVKQSDKSKYREAIFLYLLEDIRICCNI